tara:strand:+ start:633 stop:899 length:267 start_codon:yes stop_codon:yes gene_type:complete
MNEEQDMTDLVIGAVERHYQARLEEAIVRIKMYTEFPVGVGEHSSIVEEVINAVDDYQKALNGIGVVSRIKSSVEGGFSDELETQGED